MALFPKIDNPCPLDIDAQKRIKGHCDRCDKTVYSLDGMTEAQRLAFVRNANGPLCVSYRIPERRHAAGLGAALALSIAAPAFATDALPNRLDAGSQLRSVDTTHALQSSIVAQAHGPTCHDEAMVLASSTDTVRPASRPSQGLNVTTVAGGGIRPPPKLADVSDESSSSASVDNGKFETITVGGVATPGEAEWVDDSSLSDLPMVRAESVEPQR